MNDLKFFQSFDRIWQIDEFCSNQRINEHEEPPLLAFPKPGIAYTSTQCGYFWCWHE